MVDDGRPLVSLTGVCLALSGGFALFQSATGHFLPHDTEFLQTAPQALCSINACRIVHFMFHDRVSFGGSLIAIAVLYLWLAAFPLKAGDAWAWRALCLSGVVGFGSFLSYLGYGYLDTWHGAATLALLPCFIAGLWLSRQLVLKKAACSDGDASWRSLLRASTETNWRWRAGAGRACLLIAAIGLIGAGFTIQTVGMTSVFVPTDLTFMALPGGSSRVMWQSASRSIMRISVCASESRPVADRCAASLRPWRSARFPRFSPAQAGTVRIVHSGTSNPTTRG